MKKGVAKKSTDKNKDNIKRLKSKDLTNQKLFALGGTKGEDLHQQKLEKNNKNRDYYS